MDAQRIIGVLREEVPVLKELLELAEEKRTAIYKKDIEKLDAIVRREQGAALRLGHWEKQRIACMEALASLPGSPTLLFFADSAPPEQAQTLRSLNEEISALVGKLTKANAENMALVESRLEYVRFALDVFNSAQTAGLYGTGGVEQSNGGTSRTIMDTKA